MGSSGGGTRYCHNRGVIAETTPPPEPDTPARTFGADVVLTTGGKVLFVVCGALMTVLIARYLGPEGQGTFAVAYSLTLLLTQVGSIGLPVANPYFAARDPSMQRALVRHSLMLALVVAVGLAVAVAVLKGVAPDVLRGLSWVQTLITLGALPAALATVYLQGIILGQQRMVAYNLVEVSQVGTSLIALALVFAVTSAGLNDVLIVLAGGRYVALGVALWSLRGVVRGPATAHPGLLRRMLTHASRVYLVALITFALIRLDLLLVNAFLGPDDAGQYSIAAYIAEALIVIPSVVGVNLLPRLSASDQSALTGGAFRSVATIWGAVCALSVPGALIGIPLVFGHRYDDAVPLYCWLAPGLFCIGLLSILMVHYWVRGYPRVLIAAWLVGLAVNVLGNVLLLPGSGIVVAPIMSTVAYAMVLVVHLVVFAREVGGPAALIPRPLEAVRLVRAAFGR
jgi:O-antigen/teichoic acid export membrane protein